MSKKQNTLQTESFTWVNLMTLCFRMKCFAAVWRDVIILSLYLKLYWGLTGAAQNLMASKCNLKTLSQLYLQTKANLQGQEFTYQSSFLWKTYQEGQYVDLPSATSERSELDQKKASQFLVHVLKSHHPPGLQSFSLQRSPPHTDRDTSLQLTGPDGGTRCLQSSVWPAAPVPLSAPLKNLSLITHQTFRSVLSPKCTGHHKLILLKHEIICSLFQVQTMKSKILAHNHLVWSIMCHVVQFLDGVGF